MIIRFSILILFLASYLSMGQDGQLQKSQSFNDRIAAQFEAAPENVLMDINSFFDKVAKGKIEDAYNELLSNSPLIEKSEDINRLISQTKRSITIYGEFKGYEPVNIEQVSKSYMRLRFLGLNEDYPMRWIFTYYKPPGKNWTVTNVKLDDLSEFYFSDQ